MSLKIQVVFLSFFSVDNLQAVLGRSESRDVIFVASKFNREMQAMCGIILPSLYSFYCGSDCGFAKTDCYSPSNLLVRSATRRTSAMCQLSTCRNNTWHHSKHSMIILVTKPLSSTPVLSLARSKRSLKAKANHMLKILFRINDHTGA